MKTEKDESLNGLYYPIFGEHKILGFVDVSQIYTKLSYWDARQFQTYNQQELLAAFMEWKERGQTILDEAH